MSQTSFPLHEIRIVLLEGVHPRAVELLRGAGYSVETHEKALDEADLIAMAGDAHLLGIRSKTQITPAYLESANRLWAIGAFCIGTNQIDLAGAARAGVAVFNAPFSNTRSVAEKTIAEIIALHRGIVQHSIRMHRGEWIKSASGSHEVRGRTLGIIGYGRIGAQVSVLAEAIGMRVIFFDPSDCLALGNATRVETLEEVLEQSDVVTAHVPDVDSTRGLIGEREIGLMRDGAFLINNARGSVVDVEALASGLRSGKIGGAAVDVFPDEPGSNGPHFDSPLRGIESCILTPHVGGSTVEAQRNIGVEVASKLAKFMNTGATAGCVNMPEVDLPVLHENHHRLVHYHRNAPGVLGRLHSVISKAGLNVASEYLQTDPRHGYAILDVQRSDRSADVIAALKVIEGTIRARSIY